MKLEIYAPDKKNDKHKDVYDLDLETLEVVRITTSNGWCPYKLTTGEVAKILGSIEDPYMPEAHIEKKDRTYTAHYHVSTVGWGGWIGESIVENTEEKIVVSCRILGYDSDGEGLFTLNKQDYSMNKKVIKKHYN